MIGDTLARTRLPDRTASAKLIVVVRAADAADYDRVLEVLIGSGIRSVELTLTTPGTIDRLPKLLAQFGDVADIGIGTVTDGPQLAAAVDAGAHYLVTPITDPDLVDAANRAGVPIVPGAAYADGALRGMARRRGGGEDIPGQPGWSGIPQGSAGAVSRNRSGTVRRCRP